MTDPGLNIDALRALRQPNHDTRQIIGRIANHLGAHDGYLALSGGKDSLVTLDLARQADPNLPVVFFDSDLEFPETYDYLDQLQQQWRLNLQIIPASTPLINILITDGSWDHNAPDYTTPNLTQALILDPANQAHEQTGAGEIWGVRAAESVGRRAAYYTALAAAAKTCSCSAAQHKTRCGGIITRTNGTIAYGPIWDWSDNDVWEHIARHQLPLNPVYAKLRRLGVDQRSLRITHLIDADQLQYGRAVWLKHGWPDLYERLRAALPRLAEHT
ncbi:phosphoadenosine phosphosulfate reductase family protein [Propionicimonas sp.]|jgi:phosphoadenosine phosphosulfate reductase|uniref:phosphoadenosine phosphosulfate reductase family protein n=1 Tax=Propionicimonas sp. TaxID=1955623 RepID=UPI0017B92E34|nr:phosphoadenosine phosphosulfate reductase family protein [Propionicimonas sp.]MBA3019674.1 phosphoadenosine phosphosulfate reductase family protein [Propionicimonas sp.]MBU4207981.1 phosphoadenosine phosphosulfate reductase family protein [Actinomycetota bacterium]MBU4411481.1 phosphoadenosine phosphosulfate reductase family protein [Actinomycetota bacterium]MCG2805792.1 phosphoadenosine phosphosulfate reductase family protein [Propionicimonas sp.]